MGHNVPLPKVLNLTSEDVKVLRFQFEKLNEVTSFSEDIKLSCKIASYGIFREIGTVNDELARFIFDIGTGRPVRVESLKAELIEWKGLFGLRIFSLDSQRLELRAKGFYNLVHPTLSKSCDGSLHSLFIFPEIINTIAQNEGIELVSVKSWGMNSIFGGFDPSKGYYQTNLWELQNNDTLKFSDLVQNGRLAFMGTHDLIAHIAGVDQKHWPLLKQTASQVFQSINTYLTSAPTPSISALILPYTAGVVLDDLAQPPSYSSLSHRAVLEELLTEIATERIPANLPTVLTRFPESFQHIIALSRTAGIEEKPTKIRKAIRSMVQEILQSSLQTNVSPRRNSEG